VPLPIRPNASGYSEGHVIAFELVNSGFPLSGIHHEIYIVTERLANPDSFSPSSTFRPKSARHVTKEKNPLPET
jgi:hypothetical protein